MIFRILCKNWDLEKIVSFLLHEIGGIRIGRVKVLRGGELHCTPPVVFARYSKDHLSTYTWKFPQFFVADAFMNFFLRNLWNMVLCRILPDLKMTHFGHLDPKAKKIFFLGCWIKGYNIIHDSMNMYIISVYSSFNP